MKLIEPVAVTDTGSFSRASTATYWDADGVLQTAAVDEPRWQWDPETGDFEGLLVEESATNIILDSTNMATGSGWSGSATVSTDGTLAPDGVSLAWKIEDADAGANNYWHCAIAIASSSQKRTIQIAVKKGTSQYFAFQAAHYWGGTEVSRTAYIDLDAGAVSGGTATDCVITPIRDTGWYLISLSSTDNSTGNAYFRLLTYPVSSSSSEIAALTGYTYYCFPQAEVGDAPTSYIPTAVTRAADNLGTAMMLSNIPETDETEYNPATAYDIGDRCMITSASQHNVYESLTAANTGNDPALEVDPIDAPVNWQFVGKTNVWKPFDNYGSSQASVADRMVYSIVVPTGTLVDSVVLMNVDATEARIVITDADAGEVYNEAHDLVSESGIIDYWEYFFAPVRKMKNLTVTDLDVYAGVRVDVELTQSGDDVLLGVLVIGLGNEIGATMYGLRLSSTDYSVKRIDGAGNVTLTERPYSDEMSMQVWVDNPNLAAVKEQLNRVRATPIVYIGADHYGEATTVYGWHESWDTVISYPNDSILSANIKGLT